MTRLKFEATTTPKFMHTIWGDSDEDMCWTPCAIPAQLVGKRTDWPTGTYYLVDREKRGAFYQYDGLWFEYSYNAFYAPHFYGKKDPGMRVMAALVATPDKYLTSEAKDLIQYWKQAKEWREQRWDFARNDLQEKKGVCLIPTGHFEQRMREKELYGW